MGCYSAIEGCLHLPLNSLLGFLVRNGIGMDDDALAQSARTLVTIPASILMGLMGRFFALIGSSNEFMRAYK